MCYGGETFSHPATYERPPPSQRSLWDAATATWGLFASGNQLLAALALLVASVWLLNRGRNYWYTLAPGLFVLVTTLTMLVRLLVVNYIPNWQTKMTLLIADVVVLTMTFGVLVCIAVRMVELVRRPVPVEVPVGSGE